MLFFLSFYHIILWHQRLDSPLFKPGDILRQFSSTSSRRSVTLDSTAF